MINSLEEAHEIEAQRELAERRAAAAASTDVEDDRALAIVEQLAALRSALDDLERTVRPGPFKRH